MGDLKEFTVHDMDEEAVFDTKEAAETQQALDLAEWLKVHNDNPEYTKMTTRWANPAQRLDGKWAYPCCCAQDYTEKTIEDYDVEKYPTVSLEG